MLAGPVGVGEAEVAGLDRPVDRRHDVGEGDLRGATGQDFIEASVIDTRLRQLVAQRRQIALEARNGN